MEYAEVRGRCLKLYVKSMVKKNIKHPLIKCDMGYCTLNESNDLRDMHLTMRIIPTATVAVILSRKEISIVEYHRDEIFTTVSQRVKLINPPSDSKDPSTLVFLAFIVILLYQIYGCALHISLQVYNCESIVETKDLFQNKRV